MTNYNKFIKLRMRVAKSQPKLKISLSKYENFFSQKKWDDSMYMDDRKLQPSQTAKAMVSYSSLTIQPKAKLSLSLHEKVGAVLADSRKIGMIQKADNPSTRKSVAKISYVSTLPPIKTQVQETQQYLRKIKNQLNEVSLKSIKLSKEVSNIEASISQTKQRSRVLEEILGRTGQKQQNQIDSKKEITQSIKYDYEVRLHMHDTIKSDIRTLAKSKQFMEAKLKGLKIHLNSLATQLNNSMASLNSNIYTQRQYKIKQQLTSEQLMIKSEIAQNKLTYEQNAQKIHKKLSQIESYDQDQFRFETSFNEHFTTLKELRVQQILHRMMTSLFNKFQLHWQEFQKSYGLMKMYSSLNNGHPKLKANVKTQSTIKESPQINSSLANSKQKDPEIDLVFNYENSFKNREELQIKIKQKEKIIKNLESKKSILTKKWIGKFFQDSLTEGDKPSKRQTDFSKDIKKLLNREKRADSNKMIEGEALAWVQRLGDKLKFTFSKRLSSEQKFQKILQYLKAEIQNQKISEIKKDKSSMPTTRKN